ncbi:MAG: hypothetical protein WC055_12000 [Melioribacteraceae bacterium]
MKLEIRHHGRVRNGQLIWDIPDLYRQQILELEGKDVTMVIKKRHSKPTQSQYGYYRGVILVVCYEAEMFSAMSNKDEIHDLYFAQKFLSYTTITEIGGKRVEVLQIRSLADLNKDETTAFIERVIGECNELGISIPPPELAYNKYYQK